MTAAFAPDVWKLTRGTPFVLHIMDLWPESVTGSSMVRGGFTKKAINAIFTAWISAVYRRSSAIIATAPMMHGMLARRGVPILGQGDGFGVRLGDKRSIQSPRSTAALPSATAQALVAGRLVSVG